MRRARLASKYLNTLPEELVNETTGYVNTNGSALTRSEYECPAFLGSRTVRRAVCNPNEVVVTRHALTNDSCCIPSLDLYDPVMKYASELSMLLNAYAKTLRENNVDLQLWHQTQVASFIEDLPANLDLVADVDFGFRVRFGSYAFVYFYKNMDGRDQIITGFYRKGKKIGFLTARTANILVLTLKAQIVAFQEKIDAFRPKNAGDLAVEFFDNIQLAENPFYISELDDFPEGTPLEQQWPDWYVYDITI